ncbi:MAG: hypothetical protein ABI568_14125 [Pseudarthrobacter sp.]
MDLPFVCRDNLRPRTASRAELQPTVLPGEATGQRGVIAASVLGLTRGTR